MITDLTGMDISNASLLDEATSCAEAVSLAYASHNCKRAKFYVSESIFPQNIDVIQTRCYGNGVEVVIGPIADFPWDQAEQYCGMLVQNPDNVGNLSNFTQLFDKLRAHGVRSVLNSDILALCIVKSAGEMGADMAVGSVQRFGLPMGYGGPHPGYFATREEFKRKMPGRIIGISKDAEGNTALRMTLQVREQHIRRNKATSNICTAQALLANMTAMYGIWHSPKGLKQIADRVRFRTEVLRDEFAQLGIKCINEPNHFFDTLTFDCAGSGFSSSDFIISEFHKYDINLRKVTDNLVSVSLNETTTIDDLASLIEIFAHLKEET